MAPTEKRRSLGRGLSALIPPKPEAVVTERADGVRTIPVDAVLPSDGQPRQVFDESALDELAASIQTHGLLQPIVVRARGDGFELVAGERRWRASRKAGMEDIPAVVVDLAEEDVLTVALVENIQREDLNPIEEAEAYQRLHKELGYSQAQIADAVGKERSTVANALRLLKLPMSVRQQVLDGDLSMGHARALLALGSETEIEKLGKTAFRSQWTVRKTEDMVKKLKEGPAAPKAAPGTKRVESAAERDVRMRLQRALGTKVELNDKNGAGTIVVHYASNDELASLLGRLGA